MRFLIVRAGIDGVKVAVTHTATCVQRGGCPATVWEFFRFIVISDSNTSYQYMMKEVHKKYEMAVRGLDVKVTSRFFFGPWHGIMYGVYAKNGMVLGYFNSCAEALEYALSNKHRILNMFSVLLEIADENCRYRQFTRSLLEGIFTQGPRQLEWEVDCS